MPFENEVAEAQANGKNIQMVHKWQADRLALTGEAGLLTLAKAGLVKRFDPSVRYANVKANALFNSTVDKTLDVALDYLVSGADQKRAGGPFFQPNDRIAAAHELDVLSRNIRAIPEILHHKIKPGLNTFNAMKNIASLALAGSNHNPLSDTKVDKEDLSRIANDTATYRGFRFSDILTRETTGRSPPKLREFPDGDLQVLVYGVKSLRKFVQSAYLNGNPGHLRADARTDELRTIIQGGRGAIERELDLVNGRLAEIDKQDPTMEISPIVTKARAAPRSSTEEGAELSNKRKRTEPYPIADSPHLAALDNLPTRAALLQAERSRTERGLAGRGD